MARRHRRDLEDDEDDAVTPDKIEKIELEAVVRTYLRRHPHGHPHKSQHPLLQLAADENLDIIIAWLKRKHPIGGCTVHPEDHCFHNKLGHWILDTYKLLVWAIEIVSPSPNTSLQHPEHKITETPQNNRNTPSNPRSRILG